LASSTLTTSDVLHLWQVVIERWSRHGWKVAGHETQNMGEIAALSASAVWAMASIIFSRLGKSVSALALNWLKCAIALGLMFAVLAVLDGHLWPNGLSLMETGLLAASGLVGLTVGDTAFFGALNRLGARRTLLFAALSPPMTALMAVPVLGEPLGAPLVVGMSLTMGGVVWVISERHGGGDHLQIRDQDGRMTTAMKWGIGYAVTAAFCQALGNVLTKLGGSQITALEISIVRLAFGVLGLTVVLGVVGRMVGTLTTMRRPRTALMVVSATFLGTFLGIWLMNAGLRYTYVGIASTLSSTSPIFILPLAYLFDGERLTLRSVGGAAVAVAGVAVLFLW
jgi:drug/metabolite transporter (DMT)-like permease